MPVSAGEEIKLFDWAQDALCRHKNADIWYPPMDATSPNDYYAVGKLVCASCPVWEECAEAGSSETWGMWGGLTPQERKGTVRLNHGTREMYRSGCRCSECATAHDNKPDLVNLARIPSVGQTFDAKALLYEVFDS